MSLDDPVPAQMIHKLSTRGPLDASDRAAIMALPYSRRSYEAPAYLIREGEPAKAICAFVIAGLAIRQKHTASGSRQIVSIHMEGDFLDLQHMFLNRADHNVQALTRLDVAEIDRTALQRLILERPAIGRAMWIDALVDALIFREWVVNVGQRDGRARIAHLLCEFALRLKAAGVPTRDGYVLPMTQEQIGDAVGLTSVHVNRMLKALSEDGLIRRDKRHIRFDSWQKLSTVGDFSALYLHLDQTEMLAA
jgi:CRP-like cAMP-binding protein